MKILTNFLLLLFLCFFFSCSNDNASGKLLRKAQALIENEPANALAVLDSIDNPEKMNKDDYMQFIVAHTQAKYKTYQDVTSETLIFEAQKYFDGKRNFEQATLANFYAGGVYREKQMPNESLKSFLNAGYYANKSNGKTEYSGKISDNIAALYFEQNLMDSAVLYYQKTLDYYKEVKGTDLSTLKITNQIGRAYEEMSKLDSAYVYFSKALQMAEKLDNKQYKSSVTKNLGVTCFDMKEYDKAIGYFQSALDMEATDEVQKRKIDIVLLKIYNLKQDSNSAKEFALKVEASLPEVTYIKTKKEMYAALTNYYKLTGDYKQALNYSELEKETILLIAKEEQPAEMIKADTNFRIEQKDRFYGELQSDFYLYLTVGIAVLLILVVFISLALRQRKKDKEEFRLEAEKYERARRYLEASNKDYARIEAEIKEMLEDTDTENTENK